MKNFFEVNFHNSEKLHELHNSLPSLPERKTIENVEKLVTTLHYKTKYVIHIINLKQELNHGSIFKKFHWVIRFNSKAWLKPYNNMNCKLRQKSKMCFQNFIFKLMNNAVFGTLWKMWKKHRNIKLVIIKMRRNFLISELNRHTIKFFMENLIAIEMRKTQILINRPVHLGLSMLDLI